MKTLIEKAEALTENGIRLGMEKGPVLYQDQWLRGWTVYMGHIFASGPTLETALGAAIERYINQICTHTEVGIDIYGQTYCHACGDILSGYGLS